MSDFTIAKGKNTPAVKYSGTEGVLSISGRSYPEDALAFYNNLAGKLKEVKIPKQFCFELDFDYINSSSIACILDLIKDQQTISPKTKFAIHIHCAKTDDDMRDMGEHYQSISGIVVEYVFR